VQASSLDQLCCAVRLLQPRLTPRLAPGLPCRPSLQRRRRRSSDEARQSWPAVAPSVGAAFGSPAARRPPGAEHNSAAAAQAPYRAHADDPRLVIHSTAQRLLHPGAPRSISRCRRAMSADAHDQADPQQPAASASEASAGQPGSLDFTSPAFDALAALNTPGLQPPVADAPPVDNLAKARALLPPDLEDSLAHRAVVGPTTQARSRADRCRRSPAQPSAHAWRLEPIASAALTQAPVPVALCCVPAGQEGEGGGAAAAGGARRAACRGIRARPAARRHSCSHQGRAL